ncbi:MAG: hypothetical protein ACRDMV_13200, partial [Streptosporangiales bacterium]
MVTVDGKQLHPMLHRTTGVKITSGGLSGWYDAPSTRTSYAAREKAAGVFSAPAYQDKRTIGVTGIVRGVDRSDLLAQQKMLSGLAPDPYVLYELRVDEDSSLMCRVQRSDATIFKPINDRTAQYTMEFTAPDPIRYAVTPQRRGVDLAAAAPSGLNFHSSTVLRRNASTNPALSVDDAGWHGDDGTGAAGARAAVSGFDRA